ncbi:Uma2 family endonuclease [Oscillatoria sp. CS-180]|uniref:Uma2 family endonuclease n=1 Tax=Oscillatoria sp. CS-180 TaxID=3021720 RepID=UPI00233050D5|nr:Uma2 family endonuclease [Oscillatoria sp. CS-180]MDB9526030.1 Uma2 family endonuclease [Oscillatoria sp. CS-180]
MTFRALDWQAFQQIRTLLTERSHARFTYDDGILEITTPLEGHERFARLIELFIRILVVEMGLKMKSMGSTTLERQDLFKSAEPDNGYYIQNYPLVADHEVNLALDPPPDLVVEVDSTHTDINKNSLYASMGVPEFWRFDGREWTILCLSDNQYFERDRSPTFPVVTKTDFYRFLEIALSDEVAAEVEFRQWVRNQQVDSENSL